MQCLVCQEMVEVLKKGPPPKKKQQTKAAKQAIYWSAGKAGTPPHQIYKRHLCPPPTLPHPKTKNKRRAVGNLVGTEAVFEVFGGELPKPNLWCILPRDVRT